MQRLRPPLAREWLPPLDQVRHTGVRAAEGMRLRYSIIAMELRALGIDANCAPCADIAVEGTHAFLRNRCYGSDPEPVAEIALAVAAAHLAGGVLPVVKHLPGHGRATMDSHKDLPVVDAPAELLGQTDFMPFRALSGLPVMGMTAHVVYTAFDPERPATISPRLIRLIREEIGFRGLLMTDDLSMDALPGTIRERSAAAIDAGCDVVLHCNGDRAEMEAAVAEAGTMGPASARRAKAALALRSTPASPIDNEIGVLEEVLQALLAQGPDERNG